jgi:hypothetical protein
MLAWIIVVMALMAEPILGTASDTIEPQQELTGSQADVQAITQLLNNQYGFGRLFATFLAIPQPNLCNRRAILFRLAGC